MEGKGESGKMGVRSSWGLGWPEAPFFAVYLGGEPPGPRAGEAGDIVGPPGWLYGASVMG